MNSWQLSSVLLLQFILCYHDTECLLSGDFYIKGGLHHLTHDFHCKNISNETFVFIKALSGYLEAPFGHASVIETILLLLQSQVTLQCQVSTDADLNKHIGLLLSLQFDVSFLFCNKY